MIKNQNMNWKEDKWFKRKEGGKKKETKKALTKTVEEKMS